MAVHRLALGDFDCYSYQLIAIHCSIEDYRLAYLLNSHLNLRFKRKQKDLDFPVGSYSIFEWEDQNQMLKWNLVSNVCKVEKAHKLNSTLLFENQSSVSTHYLIPEYKSANYLLKVDHESGFYGEKRVIGTILSIPQVVTAYSIDIENLKSKTNLIFE